ncbi:MAG: hypothetical protein LBU83_08915 [Bacteroidales bacterium]|jgi:hypothetical protein|nr:hypothetical protein [Bacteroidales bacterium]
MKNSCLFLVVTIGCLFIACKPDFDLNAPYKDVTVVYGILNYQDTIHYVKIYKGFQSHKQGGVFIDAKNPDNIYYHNFITDTSHIIVVLQEYDNVIGTRTSRADIQLLFTHDFPRDEGLFYYEDERILYYTKEPISKQYSYKIKITNKLSGKVTEGIAPILGDFVISRLGSQIVLLGTTDVITFSQAPYVSNSPNSFASDYEIHVNLNFFEVNNNTKEVTKYKIVKNISSAVGESLKLDANGDVIKSFSKTFYDDLATFLKPNPDVVRYLGIPDPDRLSCIEVEGWAAGESMVSFLRSNQPTSSFVQINTLYSNMEVTHGEGLAFGFFSSKVKCNIREFSTNSTSEDSLVKGSKTGHLGFRYRVEYKP